MAYHYLTALLFCDFIEEIYRAFESWFDRPLPVAQWEVPAMHLSQAATYFVLHFLFAAQAAQLLEREAEAACPGPLRSVHRRRHRCVSTQ
ncbi:hypothetical protein [Paraburkholderia jirisanensis]